MAGLSSYAENALLNWINGTIAVTRPTTWAFGLSLGSPTSVSGSEMSATNYSRQLVTMSLSGNTATNANAITFGTASAAWGTVSGAQLWDTRLSSNSGNMLWNGLIAATTVGSGDTLSFAVGAIKISLS